MKLQKITRKDSQGPTSLPSLIGHLPDVRERTQLPSPEFGGPRICAPKGHNTHTRHFTGTDLKLRLILSSTLSEWSLIMHHYGDARFTQLTLLTRAVCTDETLQLAIVTSHLSYYTQCSIGGPVHTKLIGLNCSFS